MADIFEKKVYKEYKELEKVLKKKGYDGARLYLRGKTLSRDTLEKMEIICEHKEKNHSQDPQSFSFVLTLSSSLFVLLGGLMATVLLGPMYTEFISSLKSSDQAQREFGESIERLANSIFQDFMWGSVGIFVFLIIVFGFYNQRMTNLQNRNNIMRKIIGEKLIYLSKKDKKLSLVVPIIGTMMESE